MQVISWILLKKVEKQFSYWMTKIEYCICSSMIKPQTPCFSGDCPENGAFFYDLPAVVGGIMPKWWLSCSEELS